MLNYLKGLRSVGLGERIDVYIREIPVSYVKAQQIVAEIWETLHPKVKKMGSRPGLESVLVYAESLLPRKV